MFTGSQCTSSDQPDQRARQFPLRFLLLRQPLSALAVPFVQLLSAYLQAMRCRLTNTRFTDAVSSSAILSPFLLSAYVYHTVLGAVDSIKMRRRCVVEYATLRGRQHRRMRLVILANRQVFCGRYVLAPALHRPTRRAQYRQYARRSSGFPTS